MVGWSGSICLLLVQRVVLLIPSSQRNIVASPAFISSSDIPPYLVKTLAGIVIDIIFSQ